jgi:lysophospholipase L1-like esterase
MRERRDTRKLLLVVLACVLLGATSGRMAADDRPAGSTATRPAPRDAGWKKRHEGFVAMAKKGGVDLLFLGDSITDLWGGEGHRDASQGGEIFRQEFEPLKAANFGIGGDQTQHVLWRIQNGELDGIQPKVVMLMIGTNNTSRNTAEEIAEGVTAIVKEIHKRSPSTKVLLLGIFPRGEKPNNRQRDKIKQVNAIIARLEDRGKTVRYLDLGNKFLEPDGTISRKIMYDALHLTEEGYQIWADAVKGPIKELMASN